MYGSAKKLLKRTQKRNEDEPPRKSHNQPPDESNSSRAVVYTVAIQPSPKDDEWHKDQKDFWKKQIYIAKCLNWITAAAAGAGIAGLFVVYFTLKATQDAADAAKSQAISTEKTVKLTEKSLDETIKSFQLDQRAWVGPVGGGVVGGLKEGTPAIFDILIKNVGKTPALKYTPRIGLQTDPFNVKFKPRYRTDLAATRRKTSEAVIQPNGETRLNIRSNGPIPKQTIDEIRDQTIYYYVFGELLYRDVFKRPHYTRFCALVLPDLHNIGSCDTYNETDDDK